MPIHASFLFLEFLATQPKKISKQPMQLILLFRKSSRDQLFKALAIFDGELICVAGNMVVYDLQT
jgi:hypothetical protein